MFQVFVVAVKDAIGGPSSALLPIHTLNNHADGTKRAKRYFAVSFTRPEDDSPVVDNKVSRDSLQYSLQ